MSKISRYFNLIERWFVKLLLIGIVLLVFLAALLRTIGFPLPWSAEMAQLIFPWFIFLGASVAYKDDNHISINFLMNRLTVNGKRILQLVHILIIIVFLMYLIYHGTKLSVDSFNRKINSLSISYSFLTISLVVGSISMFFKSIAKTVNIIGLLKKEKL